MTDLGPRAGESGTQEISEESIWLEKARSGKIPLHVGIIMDGNGRWAQKRGLPRTEGHKAGVESIRRCLPALLNLGIKYCTLYVFSTENWKRPREEVEFLMGLIVDYASSDRKDLIEKGVRVIPIGQWRSMPANVSRALARVARDTARGENLNLLLAVNYGGRQEILEAVRKLLLASATNRELAELLTEEQFSTYLYTRGMPDPDLIIRTSGEMRLSNFLLWQSAYAELVFTSVLWPDFGPVDLYKAVVEYAGRERRFGGTGEKRG